MECRATCDNMMHFLAHIFCCPHAESTEQCHKTNSVNNQLISLTEDDSAFRARLRQEKFDLKHRHWDEKHARLVAAAKERIRVKFAIEPLSPPPELSSQEHVGPSPMIRIPKPMGLPGTDHKLGDIQGHRAPRHIETNGSDASVTGPVQTPFPPFDSRDVDEGGLAQQLLFDDTKNGIDTRQIRTRLPMRVLSHIEIMTSGPKHAVKDEAAKFEAEEKKAFAVEEMALADKKCIEEKLACKLAEEKKRAEDTRAAEAAEKANMQARRHIWLKEDAEQRDIARAKTAAAAQCKLFEDKLQARHKDWVEERKARYEERKAAAEELADEKAQAEKVQAEQVEATTDETPVAVPENLAEGSQAPFEEHNSALAVDKHETVVKAMSEGKAEMAAPEKLHSEAEVAKKGTEAGKGKHDQKPTMDFRKREEKTRADVEEQRRKWGHIKFAGPKKPADKKPTASGNQKRVAVKAEVDEAALLDEIAKIRARREEAALRATSAAPASGLPLAQTSKGDDVDDAASNASSDLMKF